MRGSPGPRQPEEPSAAERLARWQRRLEHDEATWAELSASGLLDHWPEDWRQAFDLLVPAAQEPKTFAVDLLPQLQTEQWDWNFQRGRQALQVMISIDLANQLSTLPDSDQQPWAEIISGLRPDQQLSAEWLAAQRRKLAKIADQEEREIASATLAFLLAQRNLHLPEMIAQLLDIDDHFAPGQRFADPLSYRWSYGSILMAIELCQVRQERDDHN